MFFRQFAVVLSMFLLVPTAQADSGDEAAMSPRLRSPMSVCLDAATTFYPCVSLTPMAYSSALRSPLFYSGSAVTSDSEELVPAHLFTLSIKNRDPLNPQWRALRRFEGVDLHFNLDRSGAGMNLDMGGLEFNVFLDDGDDRLLEPRFFLGVDADW